MSDGKRLLVTLALVLVGCNSGDGDGHGHGQGHGAGHGHGHGHGEDEGPEPVALTLWSATHELFVEFDPLVAGRPSAYHAHVTRIADNHPARGGRFAVLFAREGKVLQRIAVEGVARAGIFTPRGASPPAGRYQLRFAYQHGERRASWSAGAVTLSGDDPARLEQQQEGGITFLKETQWRIPFRVELPRKQAMARSLAVPATVAPDPRRSRTIAAPASGAVFWATADSTAVIGMEVKQGQVLGQLVPAAAPEHWSTLQLSIQRARIERERAEKTMQRVSGLVQDGLLPARRQLETRAALDRATAALKAAQQKVGQLRGRGAVPLPLVAPAAGTLVELHVTSGHQAAAGAVVAHVAATDQVLVRAEVFSLDLPRLETIHWATLSRAGGPRSLRLDAERAALLTQRVVVDPDTLSAPLIYRVDNSDGALNIGDLVRLTLGVGQRRELLTVPRGAVVEINTRPYLFVMKTGESFERRPVELGPDDDQRVAVLQGLGPQDRVVTRGGFDIYAASLSGAVESHRH